MTAHQNQQKESKQLNNSPFTIFFKNKMAVKTPLRAKRALNTFYFLGNDFKNKKRFGVNNYYNFVLKLFNS